MSEKLCLQWNVFKENIKSAFGSFREDKDFADVTLVCENGDLIEADKAILVASSPLFKMIFTGNKHTPSSNVSNRLEIIHIYVELGFV